MFTLSCPKRTLRIGQGLEIEVHVLNMPVDKFIASITVSIQTVGEYRGHGVVSTVATVAELRDVSWDKVYNDLMAGRITMPEWKRNFTLFPDPLNSTPTLESPLLSTRTHLRLTIHLRSDPNPNVTLDVPLVLIPSSPVPDPPAPTTASNPQPALAPPTLNRCIVRSPYAAVMPDELDLEPGHVVVLHTVHDDGWGHALNLTTGETGMLPVVVLENRVDENAPSQWSAPAVHAPELYHHHVTLSPHEIPVHYASHAAPSTSPPRPNLPPPPKRTESRAGGRPNEDDPSAQFPSPPPEMPDYRGLPGAAAGRPGTPIAPMKPSDVFAVAVDRLPVVDTRKDAESSPQTTESEAPASVLPVPAPRSHFKRSSNIDAMLAAMKSPAASLPSSPRPSHHTPDSSPAQAPTQNTDGATDSPMSRPDTDPYADYLDYFTSSADELLVLDQCVSRGSSLAGSGQAGGSAAAPAYAQPARPTSVVPARRSTGVTRLIATGVDEKTARMTLWGGDVVAAAVASGAAVKEDGVVDA
ncbi:hypothetical protein HK101_006143, partial [Irineochytrium annulatum]